MALLGTPIKTTPTGDRRLYDQGVPWFPLLRPKVKPLFLVGVVVIGVVRRAMIVVSYCC